MTTQELENFEKEAEKYRVEFKLLDGTPSSYVDWLKCHVANKTMRIVKGNYAPVVVIAQEYEKLEEKIREFNSWKGRKEFMDKKKIENLQDLASGIDFSIKQDEIIADEIPF